MSLNYAEKWQKQLLALNIQGALTSPFMTDNVKWLDAKTFHFSTLQTSGFKNHSRAGGYNAGTVTMTDKPFTLSIDRDIEFLVDKADVDETNQVASIENVAMVFQKTQAVPENDARFYEATSSAAITAGLKSTVASLSAYTSANILAKIKAVIAKVKRYRGSLIVYVKSELMDLLELALAGKGQITWTSVSGLEHSIETRVAVIDGCPIMEVIDNAGFATKIDYAPEGGGFAKHSDGYDIAILAASTEMVKSVKKISSIYYFAPGQHTKGDGYLYQDREMYDTFVFPNGKDGNVDAVAVEYIVPEEPAPEGGEGGDGNGGENVGEQL